MTKYDYLRSKIEESPCDILYTWMAFGENKITKSSKIYNADMLYKVEHDNSALNGYILYCKKSYIGSDISWEKGRLYDYSFGEITFGNDIVSPYFYVLLTREEVEKVLEDESFEEGYKNFTPYKDINAKGVVTISEEDYERCISCLGYPFITEDELEFSREEIINLAIKPALEEYFHWIPPLEITVHEAKTESTEVDMPSDAYGVVGISLQQYGTGMNSTNMSPFQYALEQSMLSGYTYGNNSIYGTNRSFGMRNGSGLVSNLQGRAYSQAVINYGRRVHYEGPYRRADNSKYIKVYSNVIGVFNIYWARRSLDFNDVEFSNRTRVFNYAQANIKELFANLRRQSKTDLPGHASYDSWITEANDTRGKIIDEYKAIVKSSYAIRGSLS